MEKLSKASILVLLKSHGKAKLLTHKEWFKQIFLHRSLNADRVHLSNYIDDDQDVTKCVRTEVTLAKEEFEEFNVALSTQVTFCLKELRAILSFAEALVQELQCRMEGAGQ